MSFTRRDFLRASLIGGGSTALLGALSRAGARAAFASGTPYKALVCVFLYGGNDSNNMLVPAWTDQGAQSGYNAYSAVRGGADFALAQSSLLTFVPSNVAGQPNTNPYGLHPAMTNLAKLLPQAAGQASPLAFVCDVGTLVGPTGPNGVPFSQASLPGNLYSHQDQQHEWQGPEADPAGAPVSGWGGLLADNLPASTLATPFPAMMSADQSALFAVGSGLPFVCQGTKLAQLAGGHVADATSWAASNTSTGVPMLDEANLVMSLAVAGGATLGNVAVDPPGSTIDWAPNSTAAAAGSLMDQLHMIFKTIYGNVSDVGGGLGLPRQVFFCGLGGFDTHTGQKVDQGNLLGELDLALSTFYGALQAYGLDSSVVTFTMSDFCRTWVPASPGSGGQGGGTDHAWGGHHLVLGSKVIGGSLYGIDPNTLLSTFLQSSSGGNVWDASATGGGAGEGRWIPGVSVDQYAATFIKWLTTGLTGGGLPLAESILPNLTKYTGSSWPRILPILNS
jgi:uncharacterized protein (DUF1501 family)